MAKMTAIPSSQYRTRDDRKSQKLPWPNFRPKNKRIRGRSISRGKAIIDFSWFHKCFTIKTGSRRFSFLNLRNTWKSILTHGSLVRKCYHSVFFRPLSSTSDASEKRYANAGRKTTKNILPSSLLLSPWPQAGGSEIIYGRYFIAASDDWGPRGVYQDVISYIQHCILARE